MGSKRILIVEDEILVSLDLETMVRGAGYSIVGPAFSVTEALNLIDHEIIDACLIDLNLRGEQAVPIVDKLDAKSIPFIIVTGHLREHLLERHRKKPIVTKPFQAQELLAILAVVVERLPTPSIGGDLAGLTDL